MLIGYARVSTDEQSLNLQIDYLKQVGCDKIYEEKMTGKTKDRPELKKALAKLKRGDTLVCLKLDRLGRSMKHLIDIVDQIKEKGCHFKTSDGIDTSTHMGVFIFHIFGALAEMELGMIKERTRLGLNAAKARGRIGGRPKGLSKRLQDKADTIIHLYKQGMKACDIATTVEIAHASVYNCLKAQGITLKTKTKNEDNHE